MSAALVPIEIALFQSDGGLTGDDDVVDVDPAPDGETVDLEVMVLRRRLLACAA